MEEDFYFAYDYDPKKKTASRLYRRVNFVFERYIPDEEQWTDSPEQACIYIGEDVFYDEISEAEAQEIIQNW